MGFFRADGWEGDYSCLKDTYEREFDSDGPAAARPVTRLTKSVAPLGSTTYYGKALPLFTKERAKARSTRRKTTARSVEDRADRVIRAPASRRSAEYAAQICKKRSQVPAP